MRSTAEIALADERPVLLCATATAAAQPIATGLASEVSIVGRSLTRSHNRLRPGEAPQVRQGGKRSPHYGSIFGRFLFRVVESPT